MKESAAVFFGQYYADSCRFSDILLFFVLLSSLALVKRIKLEVIGLKYLFILGWIIICSIVSWETLDAYFRDGVLGVRQAYVELINTDKKMLMAWKPTDYIYKRGLVCTYLNSIFSKETYKLSEDDQNRIRDIIVRRNIENSHYDSSTKSDGAKKNLVFILVESFLSSAVEEKINGFEIMPNIRRLKNEQNVIFSTKMKSNVGIGESADGQFIYMTGLLPTKNTYITSVLRYKLSYALPALLKKEGYKTMITIPSGPTEWRQNEMSYYYGIDYQNTSLDFGIKDSYLKDKDVFDLAITKEKELISPFMHLILTAEMHSPYSTEYYNILDIDWPDSYNDQWKVYLSKCYETDKQIGYYISSLKEREIFDNSIIVIAADHPAHSGLLNMSRGELDDENLPLIIMNPTMQSCCLDDSDINQLDVFPSLLNMYGISSEFTGLGFSIFRNPFPGNSITKNTILLSEKIIRGEYFRKE